MLKVLEKNGNQYFQYLTYRGWKLPLDYNVQQVVQKRVPTEFEILREELHKKNQLVSQMELPKETPKTYFFESLCALPFDRSLYMVPFLGYIEVPKYDKYNGNGDPHDHVHHFYALSMDFINEETYLLRLCP